MVELHVKPGHEVPDGDIHRAEPWMWKLQNHRVVAQVSESDGSRHQAYRLTEKGKALLRVVKAMKDWGTRVGKGHQSCTTRSNLRVGRGF